MQGSTGIEKKPCWRFSEMPDEMTPYTVKQAAKMLDANVKSVYEAIRKAEIPAIRFGRSIRIPRAAFDRLLQDGKVASVARDPAGRE